MATKFSKMDVAKKIIDIIQKWGPLALSIFTFFFVGVIDRNYKIFQSTMYYVDRFDKFPTKESHDFIIRSMLSGDKAGITGLSANPTAAEVHDFLKSHQDFLWPNLRENSISSKYFVSLQTCIESGMCSEKYLPDWICSGLRDEMFFFGEWRGIFEKYREELTSKFDWQTEITSSGVFDRTVGRYTQEWDGKYAIVQKYCKSRGNGGYYPKVHDQEN